MLQNQVVKSFDQRWSEILNEVVLAIDGVIETISNRQVVNQKNRNRCILKKVKSSIKKF